MYLRRMRAQMLAKMPNDSSTPAAILELRCISRFHSSGMGSSAHVQSVTMLPAEMPKLRPVRMRLSLQWPPGMLLSHEYL